MSDSDQLPGNQSRDPGAVTYLDQALWQRLGDASDQAAFAAAWLSLQCAMVSGAESGIVVLRDEGKFIPAASWPTPQTNTRNLVQAAEHALQEKRGVVQKLEPEGAIVAFPFAVEGEVKGVVALKLTQQADIYLRSIMRHLQWGVTWFEAFHYRTLPQAMSEQSERMSTLLRLISVCLTQPGFKLAVAAVATEIATRLGCERVSIGFVEKDKMKLHALSHSAQFDKKTNLVRQMELVKDEAADQFATVTWPRDDTDRYVISRAHEQLLEHSGAASACTVLFESDEEDSKIVGAITFEHEHEDYFGLHEVKLCEQIALVIGPILELKRRDDRMLLTKGIDAVRQQLAALLRPEKLAWKVAGIAALVLIVVMSLVTADYRVSGNATLEGRLQRHITAPVDGYVLTAAARAGDMVKKGDPLFALDDKDLHLEKLNWLSQRQQVQQKYRDALAKHQKSEASIQKAQLDQSNAQIALLDAQIERSNAVAPFDGLVVSGDLSKSLGAPVQRGDTLLKIAPMDGYRVVLRIDELEIAGIETGQQGALNLSAFPGQPMDMVIEKISPESVIDEGRNVFIVEATLVDPSPELRPGMQGTGKVHVGERSLIWIWTHSFFDWLKIWTWSWWL